MESNFNQLSPAETERLAIFIEEAGEALQAAGKILRHGYESKNPHDSKSPTNRQALERESGDLRFSMMQLCEAGDLNEALIQKRAEHKRFTIQDWLHHQAKVLK